MPSEAELQELIAARVEALKVGFRLVRREYPTDLGPVDLLCRDNAGAYVAVEIKRRGEIDGAKSHLPVAHWAVEVKRIAGLPNVQPGERALDSGELIELALLHEAELDAAAARGELTDAKTLISLMWLQKWRSGAWPLQWFTPT